MSAGDLWLPESAARTLSSHKKAPPPRIGEAPGTWAGREQLTSLQLPGGAILQFNLDRLTLGDYRAMRDHYQVNISLSMLSFMMHQIDWRIECDDATIEADVEEKLRAVWTRLVRAMSQAYWAGYSPIAIQWENDLDGRKVNFVKFKDLVPEHCRVNWKTVEGFAPPGYVKPKQYIYDGIAEMGLGYSIPVDNTVWYPLLMENGNHYGRKLLRPAFPAWFFSQLMHLFSNRYFERFGEPLPIGRAPFEDELTTSDGTTISGKQAMENILTNIRSRSVVVLPNELQHTIGGHTTKPTYEYEVEYLESQLRGVDFERYMTRLDEEISLALFTPLLMTRTADVGSYSLGETHFRSYMWMHNALAFDFKEYVDKFVLDRYVDTNYSPKAPRARWIFKEGGKTDAETLRAIITSMIVGGEAKVDVDELGVAIGLSVKEIKQVLAPPADPNAPADPAAGGAGAAAAPPSAARDPRAGRVRNDTKTKSTKSQITARLADQIKRQFRDDTFGTDKLALGYRRQFEISLIDAGYTNEDAHAHTNTAYESVNRWLAEVPAGNYRDADEVVGMVDRVLEDVVAGLVA